MLPSGPGVTINEPQLYFPPAGSHASEEETLVGREELHRSGLGEAVWSQLEPGQRFLLPQSLVAAKLPWAVIWR